MNDLRSKFFRYQAQTTQFSQALEVASAKENYIYDINAKPYLDFAAGISANTLGHSHPQVNQAIKEQIDQHLHVMVYGETIQKKPVEYCELLAKNLPQSLETTYLVNSGAEAIDGALKLAKRITGRREIISMKLSYHGNTHGAMSVSDYEPQKEKFQPLLPEIQFIRYNFKEDFDKITEKTAAVITETIQGAAGFLLPQKNYLKALKLHCEKVGAKLILDEIQPGFGRTGKLFAFEYFKIVPDILVIGKGMANGMPIGAFCSSFENMKMLSENPKLGHITTFGGNAVVAAAALETLKILTQSTLIPETLEKEKLFRKELNHPKIKQIYGKGLMIALELESEKYCIEVTKKCKEQGLIVFWLLYKTNYLRITPPLTITQEEIRKGCKIIRSILDEN